MAAAGETRRRVIGLYKELHRLGRDYPDPAYNFHKKLRGLFEKNRHLTDPEEINKAIKMGEYIRNGVFYFVFVHQPKPQLPAPETLALYSLRKYRHLKRMYPNESPSDPIP
ncbi:hypothetical protein LXA43DRAFT_1089526 [Ganoderma leucocontextum]|nr:hypothetical protein LXA43DRAFT_1089526 [Ganoderma leucocontextum]